MSADDTLKAFKFAKESIETRNNRNAAEINDQRANLERLFPDVFGGVRLIATSPEGRGVRIDYEPAQTACWPVAGSFVAVKGGESTIVRFVADAQSFRLTHPDGTEKDYDTYTQGDAAIVIATAFAKLLAR